MDIPLFLILSATYDYTAEPMPYENADDSRLRRYIHGGIDAYMKQQGYSYDTQKHEWVGAPQQTDMLPGPNVTIAEKREEDRPDD